MSRKNRSPEKQARRAKIRELLQESNISSMDDIQTHRRYAVDRAASVRVAAALKI